MNKMQLLTRLSSIPVPLAAILFSGQVDEAVTDNANHQSCDLDTYTRHDF